MARYIDAENMYKEVWKRSTSPLNEWDTWGVLNVLDMVKTEDVAPVIHAHWTITYESTAGVTDAKCSNCGYESLAYENDVHVDDDCHYCPCCGAKMDEVVE